MSARSGIVGFLVGVRSGFGCRRAGPLHPRRQAGRCHMPIPPVNRDSTRRRSARREMKSSKIVKSLWSSLCVTNQQPNFRDRRFPRAVREFRFTLVRVKSSRRLPLACAHRQTVRACQSAQHPQGYSSHRRCSTATPYKSLGRPPGLDPRPALLRPRGLASQPRAHGAAFTPRPASGTSEGSWHSAPPRRPPSRLPLAHPPPGRRPRPQAAARRPFQRRP